MEIKMAGTKCLANERIVQTVARMSPMQIQFVNKTVDKWFRNAKP